MKQLVVARIVIWSVVTVILTALLGWGLVGKQIGGGWNASGYTRAGSAEFMAGQIDEVRVEWVSGTVHIEEGRKVSFSESSYETIEEEEQLQYRLDCTRDTDQRCQLEDRIRMLSTMLREARELAVLTERYYDRGYRRNAKYTI